MIDLITSTRNILFGVFAFMAAISGSITIMRNCSRSERFLALITVMLAFILMTMVTR